MPIQFEFTEPEIVTCMKVVTPVVLSDVEAQILIDQTVHLPELAKKIDHIDGFVKDLEVEPVFIHEGLGNWHMVIPREWHNHFMHCHGGVSVIKKVIVSGILHKQVYYVDKEDHVKHVQEEIHFSKMVELSAPQPVLDEDEVTIRHFKPRIDVQWDLIRGGRLQQTGVVLIRLKIVEERQIFVQVCPSPEVCPVGNLLEDPSLEHWAGKVPLFWGAANVRPTHVAHSGSFAAELGVVPTQEAALFQTIRTNIQAGRSYKLSFWAREDFTGTSNYSLTAEVRFFDRMGMAIDGASSSFPGSAIPDNGYQQFTISTPAAPINAVTAIVRFTFMPNTSLPANTSMVKIDDVDFSCVGGI